MKVLIYLRNRGLALFMALVMCLSLLPAQALAAEIDGGEWRKLTSYTCNKSINRQPISTGETRSILVSNDASRAIGNIHEVSLTSPNLQAGSHCILTAKVDPASSYPSSPQKGNGAPASKTAAESEKLYQ